MKQAGFSVWDDDRIDPHTSWDETIEREIAAAKAVVVRWTPRSVASQWVRNEPLQDLIFLRVLNDDVGAATEPIGSGTCAIPSTGPPWT